MRISLNSTRAFTLVELMVGLLITTIIIVMVGTVFSAITTSSLRGNQRIDSFRDARGALNTIRRDLTNLVRAPSTTYFVLADQYSDPNSAANKNRQIYGLTAVSPITFTAPNANGLGDVCTIGYYCRWDTTKHCYSLRRYYSGSSATSTIFTNYGLSVAMGTLFAPTTSDETVAAFAWNLQVTVYKNDGTTDSTYPMAVGAANIGQLPAAIEISFDAISPEAAQPLLNVSSTPNDWMDPTTANYKALLLPRMYEFRTRISF
jgi:type II secretory pathway pseudopilin PulG